MVEPLYFLTRLSHMCVVRVVAIFLVSILGDKPLTSSYLLLEKKKLTGNCQGTNRGEGKNSPYLARDMEPSVWSLRQGPECVIFRVYFTSSERNTPQFLVEYKHKALVLMKRVERTNVES